MDAERAIRRDAGEPSVERRANPHPILARPEGFEPPTNWFEASYSIQLSYGRPVGRECLRTGRS